MDEFCLFKYASISIDFSVLHFGCYLPTQPFQIFQRIPAGEVWSGIVSLNTFAMILLYFFFPETLHKKLGCLWSVNLGPCGASSLADGVWMMYHVQGVEGGSLLDGSKQLIRWGLEELNCEAKNIAAPINSASFWSCNPSFPNSGRWTMITVWWESHELDSPYAQVASNKISNSWDFQEGKGRGEKEGRSDITSRRMDEVVLIAGGLVSISENSSVRRYSWPLKIGICCN